MSEPDENTDRPYEMNLNTEDGLLFARTDRESQITA